VTASQLPGEAGPAHINNDGPDRALEDGCGVFGRAAVEAILKFSTQEIAGPNNRIGGMDKEVPSVGTSARRKDCAFRIASLSWTDRG